MDSDMIRNLRKSLKVEVQAALAGETPQSVALLLRADRLPRAVVTDSRGVSTTRVVSYVDLLATLDGTTTVTALANEAVNRIPLATPPDGTLLLDLIEHSSASSYVLTGHMPSREYLFSLEQGAPGQQEKELKTYNITLPPIVYRALWHERTQSVSELSICLLSPDLAGEPSPEADLYRWPFSNVYTTFGCVLEGVCWHRKEQIQTPLAGIPERLVERFVGIPNDADRYSADLSVNAPPDTPTGYAGLLETIEELGGVPHDWLVPAGRTVRELHTQEGRDKQT